MSIITLRGGSQFGSSTESMKGSIERDLLEMKNSYFDKGICRGAPLSQTGKRLQLFKMLCLNVLPILCLWAYTVYRLADSVDYRDEYFKRRDSLYYSIDLGKLVHNLQVERDMSVLYLSAIGPDTKSFLLTEYGRTDITLQQLTSWPTDLDDAYQSEMFLSKDIFGDYLTDHRNSLTAISSTVEDEIDFYSNCIDRIIAWLYDTITESKFSLVWKILVAYQKLSNAKENLGVERAFGSIFFARGGFEERSFFEKYNRRVHSFRAYMRSIGMYSNVVSEIYDRNIANLPENFSRNINNFREEIQTAVQNLTDVNIKEARFFFDNMTIYLDTLFIVQNEMAAYVIQKFNDAIDDLTRDLIINAILLVIVILVCPVVIIATESLTSSIQAYALTLVDKTKELKTEKQKTDGLLYQMVPKPVADLLKRKKKVEAEFFKVVTICFSDIEDFDKLTVQLTPFEIVDLLNELYSTVDEVLDEFDVYKVETINDSYMVASGLPKRNKKHATEIAELSLKMLKIVSEMNFLGRRLKVNLRVGINSGPCMAGIVGSLMPRYCLFGDTVNTASRMKSYSTSNQIHVSHSTYLLLQKTNNYSLKKRGSVSVKGKGEMRTYWLIGRKTDSESDFSDIADVASTTSTSLNIVDIPGEIKTGKTFPMPGRPLEVIKIEYDNHHGVSREELPGEITTIESPTYSASLNYPMPGRQALNGARSHNKKGQESSKKSSKPATTEESDRPTYTDKSDTPTNTEPLNRPKTMDKPTSARS